jgi:hypothetical protein
MVDERLERREKRSSEYHESWRSNCLHMSPRCYHARVVGFIYLEQRLEWKEIEA